MNEHYDIFISYRRDGGFETAKHLNDLLVHDGYTVSFDIDTLREGDFDETLLKRIDQCVDFILVVDKHTFDRTLDSEFDPKKDWLRTELAYALKLRKNIIPVLLSGVNGFPTNLPEDVVDVTTKNGPEYNKYYFDEFYRRLKSFLHCIPRNAKIEDKDYATITLYSDSDASVSSDGEHIANVKAKEFTKVQVPLGEHVFEYVLTQDSSWRYSEVHALNEVKNYVIQIKFRKQKFPITSSLLIKIIVGIVVVAAITWGVYYAIKPESGECQTEEVEYPTNVEVEYYDETLFVNGIPYKMLPIKGGEFYMGIDADEEAQKHKVTLSDYMIGETEIPQSIWEAVMGSNPSRHVGQNYPVEQISWNDCQLFIARLNKLSGQTFRLPTEAEWEYAARGKDDGIYEHRNLVNKPTREGNARITLQSYAWYSVNSGHTTHAIGMKLPNGWGLKDVFGNVWEWCNDKHAVYSKSDVKDPKGPETGDMNVFRGGGCGSEAEACSPTFSGACMPEESADALGIRLAK